MNKLFSNYWILNPAVFLLFFTSFYSIWISRKNIIRCFKDIKNGSYLILLGIIIFVILNIVLFSFPFQTAEGWEGLLLGKYLSQGNTEKFWFSHRHGVIYPYILGLFFKILGTNPEVVSLITYLSGICCVIGVFLLSYLIFNEDKISIYAVFLYIFSHFFFQYVLRYKGFHIFASMLSVYSVLFIIMALHMNKVSLFLSGFSISIIAANTRSELFLYTIFLTIAWILRRKYLEQDISGRQKIVFYLLFACNLIITFLDIYNSRVLWGFGNLIKEFTIPFYIKYVFHRIIDYVIMWFGKDHLIFLLAAIFAFVGIKKYSQNHTFILFLIFLFHSGIYIIFASTVYHLENRYIAIVSPLFFPFLGYGLFKLLEPNQLFRYNRFSILKFIFNVISIIFLVIFVISKPKAYMMFKKEDNILMSWQRYEKVRDVRQLIDLTIPKNTLQKPFILVGQPEFANELKFLTDMSIWCFQEIKIHENKISLPSMTPVSQIIYIHTPDLEILDMGDSFVNNYKEMAKSFISMSSAEIGNVENWRIYLITLSSETSLYSCHTLQINYKYPYSLGYNSHKEILEEIDRKIIEQPKNPRLFLDRGVVFSFMGKFYEAENDFKSAIKFDPNCVEAYISLGSIYSKLNRPKEAVNSYTSAMLALKRVRHIYRGATDIEFYREAKKGLQSAIKSMKQK